MSLCLHSVSQSGTPRLSGTSRVGPLIRELLVALRELRSALRELRLARHGLRLTLRELRLALCELRLELHEPWSHLSSVDGGLHFAGCYWHFVSC